MGYGVAGPSNCHSIGLDNALAVFASVALHITPPDISTIRLPEPLVTASMPGQGGLE